MRSWIVAAALALAPAAAHAADYDVDAAHSAASFSVKHMMISNVRGELSGMKGRVSFAKPDLSDARIDISLDASTIDTREPKRDAHLRSPDFFDVAKFPTLTFRSTSVSRQGDKVKIAGDLTLHGVTRRVTFDATPPSAEVKDPWGNARIAAAATTKINRKDFGLTWNKALEAGGVLVGDEVSIEVNLELVRKAEPVKKAER